MIFIDLLSYSSARSLSLIVQLKRG